MKPFKLISILAGLLFLTLATACRQKVEDPYITILTDATVNLTREKTTLTVKIETNREWGVRMVGTTTDWIVAEPERGPASKKPIEIKVTVAENTGVNRTAAIEFYTGVATAMVTVIQEGPEGESDGVQSLTVADFIAKADKSNYYRLTGTVSGFNSNYCSFDLTDETGKIYVYSVSESSKAAWSGVIKNGGTVKLQGQYDFFASKSQHEVINAIIESFTPGEEQKEITDATVAEFVANASETIYYRLTGTVSAFKTGNNNGRDWMQFNLTDDTGSILVYGFENGQFEEWAEKIKDNGTVTLVGTYQFYSDKSQHEVMNTKIESFKEGEAPQAVTVTVTEAIALPDNKTLIIEEATVAGISTMGLVVTDGTSFAYIYFDSKAGESVPEVAVGDKVKVEATKSTYNDVPELVKSTVTKLSTGEMTYPEPKDLTETVTTYTSSVTEYVKLTGTLSIDKGKGYYNLAIAGVSPDTKQGSISGPLPSLGIDDFEGSEITVTGFFIGLASKGKFINILATEAALANPDAKYCNVSPTTINAKADDTSVTFEIKTNAAWTAVCDNADFTVSPASGNGDAVVTVSFDVNDGDAARIANITVTCADADVEETVVLAQARRPVGEATTISIDFTSEIAALPQAKANGLVDGTVTLEGYDFIMHAAGQSKNNSTGEMEDNKFYQAKSNDSFYLIIGKEGAYIQLPVIEDKALTKIEFRTGVQVSQNVVVDVAKSDGTRLNVNKDTFARDKEYTWVVTTEVGVAYKLLVTNDYNAQFQNLTLTYE